MAYLYRHIRLDKNEPFYIGIGSDSSYKYKRAYSIRNRNNYWKNIVVKTEYRVDILLDDLTWEEACEKEKEFILLYGRKDLNNGNLCNLTNGGDGALGIIRSKEYCEKLSIFRKGKKMSLNKRIEFNKNYLKRDLLDSDIEKIKHRINKEIIKSSGQINKTHRIERNSKMSKLFTGVNNPFYGKKHSEEFKNKQSIIKSKMYIGGNNPSAKIVLNSVTGIYYDCAKDAAISINMNKYTFRSMLNGSKKNKTSFNYI